MTPKRRFSYALMASWVYPQRSMEFRWDVGGGKVGEWERKQCLWMKGGMWGVLRG